MHYNSDLENADDVDLIKTLTYFSYTTKMVTVLCDMQQCKDLQFVLCITEIINNEYKTNNQLYLLIVVNHISSFVLV